MRLSHSDIDAIKSVVTDICGERAVVRLFGSRLDDTSRGGDIDLMVELDEAVEHPARLSAWLSVKIMCATQGATQPRRTADSPYPSRAGGYTGP